MITKGGADMVDRSGLFAFLRRHRDPAGDRHDRTTKKAISAESFVFLIIVGSLFFLLGKKMGGVNMMNTMMNTAYALLMDTVLKKSFNS